LATALAAEIQDWLIAAVQNIAIVCGGTSAAVGARLKTPPKERIGRLQPGFLARLLSAPPPLPWLGIDYTSLAMPKIAA
jgi:hypothetical protein